MLEPFCFARAAFHAIMVLCYLEFLHSQQHNALPGRSIAHKSCQPCFLLITTLGQHLLLIGISLGFIHRSSLQVLNYGQSVFEGMKAQRSAKDRIVLFRPDQNAARMAAGAKRLSMPAPPTDLFVGAVQELVRENQDYVPPQGKGSLYIRPLLMGSGGILGLGPAPSYTFAIFCAAVGAYFKVRASRAMLHACLCLRSCLLYFHHYTVASWQA